MMNAPQMIVFSLTTAYMIGAAAFCVYQAVKLSGDSLIMAQICISLASTCASRFRCILDDSLTLRSADGCYLVASLIAGDPWVRLFFSQAVALDLTQASTQHMVTSLLQYLLLAPSYSASPFSVSPSHISLIHIAFSVNLLNIYAFANLHDFSWGTKEQTTSEIDLGITKKVNQNEVDMALPADQSDIGASSAFLSRVRRR